MYMVYWTQVEPDGRQVPDCRLFESMDMVAAMAFMEALRARQRAGEGLRFITMSSENPDSVGPQGVDVTGPGYGWTKRRHRF
jgi:hypothetical protein